MTPYSNIKVNLTVCLICKWLTRLVDTDFTLIHPANKKKDQDLALKKFQPNLWIKLFNATSFAEISTGSMKSMKLIDKQKNYWIYAKILKHKTTNQAPSGHYIHRWYKNASKWSPKYASSITMFSLMKMKYTGAGGLKNLTRKVLRLVPVERMIQSEFYLSLL